MGGISILRDSLKLTVLRASTPVGTMLAGAGVLFQFSPYMHFFLTDLRLYFKTVQEGPSASNCRAALHFMKPVDTICSTSGPLSCHQ